MLKSKQVQIMPRFVITLLLLQATGAGSELENKVRSQACTDTQEQFLPIGGSGSITASSRIYCGSVLDEE